MLRLANAHFYAVIWTWKIFFRYQNFYIIFLIRKIFFGHKFLILFFQFEKFSPGPDFWYQFSGFGKFSLEHRLPKLFFLIKKLIRGKKIFTLCRGRILVVTNIWPWNRKSCIFWRIEFIMAAGGLWCPENWGESLAAWQQGD